MNSIIVLSYSHDLPPPSRLNIQLKYCFYKNSPCFRKLSSLGKFIIFKDTSPAISAIVGTLAFHFVSAHPNLTPLTRIITKYCLLSHASL